MVNRNCSPPTSITTRVTAMTVTVNCRILALRKDDCKHGVIDIVSRLIKYVGVDASVDEIGMVMLSAEIDDLTEMGSYPVQWYRQMSSCSLCSIAETPFPDDGRTKGAR